MADLESWLPLLRSPGGRYCLHRDDGGLVDEVGHRYPVEGDIPRFVPPGESWSEDARSARFYDRMAPVYTWSERVGARVLTGTDLRVQQHRMITSLGIAAGRQVLEVSPGPAVFQPWLAEAVGAEGTLAAVDLSWGMVRRCVARTRQQVPSPLVCQGTGAALPFADGAFDDVFHFGGIKLFARPGQALQEFARVVRPGGHVFVGDEGCAPDVPDGWRRRLLERTNPGFRRPPPPVTPHLVLTTQSWVYGGYAFLWTLTRVDADL